MPSIYGEYSKYTRLRIDYSISQDIDNNTSTINMTMFAERTKASQQAYNPSYYSMTGKEQTAFSYNWSASSYELEIGSSTTTVKHNEDGTAEITLEGYWNTRRTGSNYIPEELWISEKITLPTIPRISQISLNTSSVTLGNPITISTNRASSSFKHALYWQVGNGAWNTIATEIADSYSWTVPLEIANSFPNNSTGTVSIICETYNNDTYIGASRANLVITIPEAGVMPSILNVSVTGGTNGVFVETLSNVNVAFSASGSYGSSIASYRVEMWKGATKLKEAIGNNVTLNLNNLNIEVDTDIQLICCATDTRGRTTTNIQTINVKWYYKPKINARIAYRCNADGSQNRKGTYLYIYWVFSARSIAGVTSDIIAVKYRKKDGEWINVELPNATGIVVGDGGISLVSQYQVNYYVADGTGNYDSITDTIQTGATCVNYKAGGKGIAFGKIAEKDGFECNMPTWFEDDIIDRNENELRADIYSVQANDWAFDDVKSNIIGSKAYRDLRPYIITNAPLTDDNYTQGGMSHTVIGMEYGNQQYGSQLSMACSGNILFRRKYYGNWYPWSMLHQVFTRTTDADFNNLTETGVYLDGSAPTGANYPVAWTGILEVFNKDGIITQKYTYFQGNIIFSRAYTNWNGTWTSWRKTAGTILLTAIPSSRLAITGTAWTNQTISLNSEKSDVSSGLLTLSGGGIRIGKSINLVKVSASLSYFEYATTGETDLHILKNSEVVASIFHAALQSNTINNMTTNPIVIDVTEGDIISIAISKNSDISMTVLNNNGATSLTVEVV